MAANFDETRGIISIAANEIKLAFEITLNPLSSQLERQKAYQVHEDFKTNSPLCADVGFYLFQREQNFNPTIRLCGLQLVDEFIKLHWNDLLEEKKNQFKLDAINLVKLAVFDEPIYLKEFVVKVIVEVIKRSWPQQWSSLFTDLALLQSTGSAQLEIVLIILMRLSEDINGLDASLSSQRRKDMLQTLNSNLPDLFEFFINTLQEKVTLLKAVRTEETMRLAEAALFTITGYASWVNFSYLTAKEKILFQVLFWLLEVDKLKYHACTCLNIIFERKGQPEQRLDLLIILSQDVLSIVGNAAALSNTSAAHDEEEYKFLKKLVETMSNFGRIQIALLWGDDKGFSKRPESFEAYLQLMLDFSKHDSMMIGMTAAKVWHAFSIHKDIKTDEVFLKYVPQILDCLILKMAKIGNPNLSNSPASLYSLMDFDDIKEYHEAFGEIRCDMLIVLRYLTDISPYIVLNHCHSQIIKATSTAPPIVTDLSVEKLTSHMHYISWEALSHYTKNGFSSVFFKTNKKASPKTITMCNEMLKSLIEYKCDVPLFLLPVVHCIEAIFPIFKHSQDYLLPVIQMLCGVFDAEQKNESQYFKLKRHICVAFSNLCKEIPDLLVTMFDDLETYVGRQFQSNSLTNHEKSVLLEGLFNICKSLPNNAKQKEFIDKILNYPKSVFTRADVQQALHDPVKLISFIGLDQDQCDGGEVEERRRELIMALYTLQSAVKSLTVPSSDQAEDNLTEKYPWLQPSINMLPYLFDLAQQYCFLWTVEDKITSSNKAALLFTGCEMQGIMGKTKKEEESNQLSDASQVNKMQFFLFSIHELIYATLSFYGKSIGTTLYSLSGLSEAMIEKLVKSWTHLPNQRLRKILKSFLKLFTLSCPSSYYTLTLGPFLSVALDQLFKRISTEWERVKELTKQIKQKECNEEEKSETKEIEEERIMYNLSREFIDLLVSFLTYKTNNEKVDSRPLDGSTEVLGMLGEFLLTYEGTSLTLIISLFSAISWPDTGVVNKICCLLISVIKKVFAPDAHVNPEIPNHLLLLLLQGLQIHGSDPTGQASITNAAMHFYTHMRMRHPSIVNVMMMVPSCAEEDLKQFDISVFASETPLTENQKRKRFRKLLEGACGKTISELHKNNIEIKNLPPLAPRVKPNKCLPSTTESSGLCALFGEDT